ncbi:DNA-directed RNA polymerase subunit A', partial [Candidatus Woesearchaeota archaeon]|nr:DNA-directed RNA polymerase subunit A' [Candidatus Woesearchaeota archaeon]
GENVSEQANLKKNSTVLMALSGARGNLLNLAQMSACVGQQSLGGSRVKNGYKNRTLSVFKRGSLEPSSRGFIRRGYKNGMTPYEFFFHGMTGRDSLMDTALRTPKSGYLYRRLANALQDLRIEYDNTVRDGNKRVIQFVYGDDNVDISKSEGGVINVKRIVKEIAENG